MSRERQTLATAAQESQVMAVDQLPVSYEVYSTNGRKMGEYRTQVEAERMRGMAFNAKYLIGVATNGDRICIQERKELH